MDENSGKKDDAKTIEVKKELDDRQEPTSECDHEDQMTLKQYLISKGKFITHHPSAASEVSPFSRNLLKSRLYGLMHAWALKA